MTQEQKELLLKDLCARLPYGVKFRYKYIDEFFHENYGTSTLTGVRPPYRIEHLTLVGNEYLEIEKAKIKPYLFPLSSMTKEQKEEYHNLCSVGTDECGDIIYFNTYESIDYLNKNKFDYRYLIPMGLAIDTTNLNIY